MKFFGVILIIVGVTAGLYMGVWWALIGGIVDVIDAIRADEVIVLDVAIGVTKIVFSQLIGYISCVVFFFPGYVMMKTGTSSGKFRRSI